MHNHSHTVYWVISAFGGVCLLWLAVQGLFSACWGACKRPKA